MAEMEPTMTRPTDRDLRIQYWKNSGWFTDEQITSLVDDFKPSMSEAHYIFRARLREAGQASGHQRAPAAIRRLLDWLADWSERKSR